MSVKQIYYSEKYYDEVFEYRHVLLPKEIAKLVPKRHLMSETEWRSLGVQQSQGWEHYMKHDPGRYWKFSGFQTTALGFRQQHLLQRVGDEAPGVVVWSLSVVLSWFGWEMLGDISYDKATLKIRGASHSVIQKGKD